MDYSKMESARTKNIDGLERSVLVWSSVYPLDTAAVSSGVEGDGWHDWSDRGEVKSRKGLGGGWSRQRL